MKPPLDEARLKYAVDRLAREMDASKHEIREALTNEARYYRNEEPETELRLSELD